MEGTASWDIFPPLFQKTAGEQVTTYLMHFSSHVTIDGGWKGLCEAEQFCSAKAQKCQQHNWVKCDHSACGTNLWNVWNYRNTNHMNTLYSLFSQLFFISIFQGIVDQVANGQSLQFYWHACSSWVSDSKCPAPLHIQKFPPCLQTTFTTSTISTKQANHEWRELLCHWATARAIMDKISVCRGKTCTTTDCLKIICDMWFLSALLISGVHK